MNRRALLGFGLAILAIAATSTDAAPAQATDLQLAEVIQPSLSLSPDFQAGLQIDQQMGWRRGPRPRWGGSQ